MPDRTVVPPDHLVITAANATQATGYQALLESRRRAGRLPEPTRTHVLTDPGGRRVGSGGSTLLALRHLAQLLPAQDTLAKTFSGLRIFILHAGGDSKRLPAYAALGKLFTPLPCLTPDGQPATLFDLMLVNLQKIPMPPTGHVLVGSGDVLLTFDPSEVDLSGPGVTGVTYPDSVERAGRHGVYVLDGNGQVVNFLQKPRADELRQHQALDAAGRALIDTGLLNFDPQAVAILCQAAGLRLERGCAVCQPGLLADLELGDAPEVDLYEEITLALATEVSPEEYEKRLLQLPRNQAPRQANRLRQLHQALHGLPFRARVLSYCDFFHLGTSKELLVGLVGRSRTSATYGFRNRTLAVAPCDWSEERAFIYNAILEAEGSECGSTVLVEGTHARCRLELQGRNILTGVCGEVPRPIRLPEGSALFMLPVGPDQDWAAIIYGIEDDFRRLRLEGGCSFLNAPIDEFLRRHAIAPESVWPEGDQSLFRARLWCAGSADEAVSLVLWMLEESPEPAVIAEWRRRPRWGIADLLQQVNHARLIEQRADLQRRVALHRVFERLQREPDLAALPLVEQVHSRAEATEVLEDLSRGLAKNTNLQMRARALILAMHLGQRVDSLPSDLSHRARWEACLRTLTKGEPRVDLLGVAASTAVAEAVALQVSLPQGQATAQVEQDQVIWVTAPARLDFAGGWSDTPPICTDRGGAVVNAAVRLNGQYPIQAIAKLNEERTIHLTSIDLGQRVRLERVEDLLDYTDPRQWTSLPKACLYLAGLCAGRTTGPLSEVLRPFGGGLDLTLFSALPKGSGLGTSSILGAAVLSCLARVTGEVLSQDQLIGRTSLLEQMMTTGGGWQDQVGGILPGVKLIRTQPGLDQTPSVFWSAFFEGGMAKRQMLLYYTGFRRLARDILQKVVHRYLARDAQVLHTIELLKEGAMEVRRCIDTRDLDGFGRGVVRYWELKKRIDPGATTPAIEALTDRVAPFCTGYTLLGAGGGGFLLMITHNEDATRQLRNDLTHSPSAPGARFFDFSIDAKGLQVCVL
jgi:fucokinase